MNFWLRNAILGVILIALAYAFFANQDFLLSLDGSMAQVDSTTMTNTPIIDQKKIKPIAQAPIKKSTNAAAVGLSKFYASIYGDKDKNGPKIRNNVIFLPDPKGDLVKLLQAREMVVRPYRKNWRGGVESRPFRKGETLYQKLAEFAGQEGLEVLWWLNRDFIIKVPFRIEKDILKTAFKVGNAIEGHFNDGVSTYFCYRQRAIVLINNPIEYLKEECIFLGANAY
ncbi:MAG: toxin co-regulated pilus biosynthesis Q family protein [Colwellia sp.]